MKKSLHHVCLLSESPLQTVMEIEVFLPPLLGFSLATAEECQMIGVSTASY